MAWIVLQVASLFVGQLECSDTQSLRPFQDFFVLGTSVEFDQKASKIFLPILFSLHVYQKLEMT